MNYLERGAGGFSGLRRAGAGENRASPPVQQLDVSEYLTASEAGSERGRSRHRGHPEDRPSVGREDIGWSFDQEDREPAGCREEDPDPPANAGHHLGGGRPWAEAAEDRPPMPPRHSASAPLPPRGLPGVLPGRVRACSSPGGTATTLLREAAADPCRGDLRQATGQDSLPHRFWDLGWRLCRA
jgi:hypothetical protein